MRRVKPGWKVIGIVLTLVIVWQVGLPRLRSIDFFQVRRVELVGARFAQAEFIARALDIPKGMSVFDPLGPLQRRADALSGFDRVTVSRRLPGVIRVQVVERIPVALVPDGGVLRMVDAAGRILPWDPARTPADLPVVRSDPVLAEVLARIQHADLALFQEVRGARTVDGGVALDLSDRRLFVRRGVTPTELRAMRAVATDLADRGQTYREIDCRYSGRVIVRGRTT